MKSEPIALFDMDGTLADYDKAMRRDMQRLQSPDEIPYVGGRHEAEYMKNRMDLIRQQPGWWRSLERYEPGFEILEAVLEADFQCHVLTKGPRRAKSAWTEKVQWCEENVRDTPVTVTEDKGLFYGKVLVDDWPEYVTRWLKWRTRGLVIMPAHPWNEDYEHPNVLRYTGKEMLPEVRAKLMIIRATCEPAEQP